MLNFLRGKPFVSYLLAVSLLTPVNSFMIPFGLMHALVYLKIHSDRFLIELLMKSINAFYDVTIVFISVFFNEYRLSLNPLQSPDQSVNIDLWLEKISPVCGIFIVFAYFTAYFCFSYFIFSFGTFFNGLFYSDNPYILARIMGVAIILSLYDPPADLSLIANAPLAAVFRKIRLSLCKQKG